jgi:hypothetical protein
LQAAATQSTVNSQVSAGDSAAASERGKPQSATESNSIDVDAMDEEPAREQSAVSQVCSNVDSLLLLPSIAAMVINGSAELLLSAIVAVYRKCGAVRIACNCSSSAAILSALLTTAAAGRAATAASASTAAAAAAATTAAAAAATTATAATAAAAAATAQKAEAAAAATAAAAARAGAG